MLLIGRAGCFAMDSFAIFLRIGGVAGVVVEYSVMVLLQCKGIYMDICKLVKTVDIIISDMLLN